MLREYTDDCAMPAFLMFPRALRRWKLSGTEVLLYLSLLDRTRLSARNEGWRDEGGSVWCYYPVRALAGDLDRCESVVKDGLRGLEKKGLLRRQRQGQGKPDRLFVRIPGEDGPDAREDGKPARQEGGKPNSQESRRSVPQESRRSNSPEDGKPVPNQKERDKMSDPKQGSKKRAWGKYRNVLLTEAEYAALEREYPDLPSRIEKLSIFLEHQVWRSPDHAALMREKEFVLGPSGKPPGGSR